MISTSIGSQRQALQLAASSGLALGLEPRAGMMQQSPLGNLAVAPQDGASVHTKADDVEFAFYDDLAAVERIWGAFEDTADHTFFQTFAWHDAWLRHVGTRLRTVPAVVTGARPDGTLLFILPLAVQKQRGIRLLAFLGSELCDYNAPLLHPAFGEFFAASDFAALWRRILRALQSDGRFAFDMVDLVKMPLRVGQQSNPFMALRTEPNPSGAYITALGGSWDEFYKLKRSSSTRKKERSQLRQLAEFGPVRFVDGLEGEERTRTLNLLFAQKASSFARMGVRNIFARPGHRELFTAFAMDPRSRHLVHLSRLEIGDAIAAASIGFTARGCYSLVLSSYEGQGEIARLGPGRAHLNELLGYAIERGFDTFDFTIGDEAYKQDWSDSCLTLYDHMSPATPVGLVAMAAATRFRAAKRAIKQNPHFWRLFSRARSWLGARRSRSSVPAETHAGRDSAAATSREQ